MRYRVAREASASFIATLIHVGAGERFFVLWEPEKFVDEHGVEGEDRRNGSWIPASAEGDKFYPERRKNRWKLKIPRARAARRQREK